MFQNDKRSFLSKKDKSRKGSIDEPVKKLVEVINSKDVYFTTSSCSGRILLVQSALNSRKEDVNYVFCSHRIVASEELNAKLDSEGDIWLKQENAILHVACRTMEDASSLVNSAKSCGFRRSGITAFGKKIVVEVCSPDNISVLVVKDKKRLVDLDFIKVTCAEMNKRLVENHRRIVRLEKLLSLV